eukprot:scaffold27683_cov90-Isochrysis_galbana.AAC.1
MGGRAPPPIPPSDSARAHGACMAKAEGSGRPPAGPGWPAAQPPPSSSAMKEAYSSSMLAPLPPCCCGGPPKPCSAPAGGGGGRHSAPLAAVLPQLATDTTAASSSLSVPAGRGRWRGPLATRVGHASQRTIDDGELPHLLLLLLHRLVRVGVKHRLDEHLPFLHRRLVRPFDEHVHWLLVLRAEGLPVVPVAAVLDGALAPDDDLAARLPLHPLLSVAARPDDGPEKVVARVLVDRDDELPPAPLRNLWLERIHQVLPLLQELPPAPHLARVDARPG